jgi:hypothetical protein
MTFGYTASAGGYAVWLARRTGAGAARALGAMSYQMLSDLCAVCWFALGAALLGGESLPAAARAPVVLVAAGGAIGLTALALVGARAAPRRVRRSRFVATWDRVGPARFAASLLLRLATVAINVGGTCLAARAFGLPVPAGALAVGLPIVYLVGALPANVLGLGAVTAAWVAVFGRWADSADILAFQLLFQLLSTAAIVARGLPFLPSVLRDLQPEQPPAQ